MTHDHNHKHDQNHEHHHDCCCAHHESHNHEHEHPHEHEHDHNHENHGNHTEVHAKTSTKIYTIADLGCPNCAAKMEHELNRLPGVANATVTYTNKQLRLTATDPDALIAEAEAICRHIEPQVSIHPYDSHSSHTHEHNHEHNHSHNHAHEHEHNHSHNHTSFPLSEKMSLIIGSLLFAVGMAIHILAADSANSTLYQLLIFVPAYLLLGGEVLLNAISNIRRGQVFDENLLMSIATIGAFAIAEYPEAVGVMLFYRIGEYFQDKAVEKSRSQIMQTIDMRPETVTKLSATQTEEVIPAEAACPGDILLVRPGDRIPLDAVIVSGESLLDTSAITGESVPRRVRPGDTILSGCLNTDGLLTVRVTKPLAESMMSRILESVENAAANKPKIDKFISRFARVYTPLVVLAAVLIAIIPPLFFGEPLYWLKTALTFLVISCPCALVLSIPLAFFAGIGAASRSGILFKGGATIEALANTKAVLMDKTGTLTKGTFTVRALEPAPGVTENDLLAAAAAAEASSNHPVAKSIIAACLERNINFTPATSAQEVAGQGIIAQNTTDKNNQTILCGNRRLMQTHGINLPANTTQTTGAEVHIATISPRNTGRYLGRISIADELKPDSAAAVTAMQKRNLHTVMLTGDNHTAANEIANTIGLDEFISDLLPQEKLSHMQKLRSTHGAVLYVGDGINDAPVLAGADVGAAMGQGADAAIEAADVVFMNSNLSAVPQSIDLAKATCRIAKQNVWLAIGIKLFVMLLGLMHMADLWLAVFADTGVALLCMLNSMRILYRKNF